MEEQVGALWHRLVTRAARHNYPEAAVSLSQARHTAGILFRACGGDSGLRVEAANPQAHGARRRWLQRLAGIDSHAELASRDEQALRLPAQISVFSDSRLNRDLYLWLTALASQGAPSRQEWFMDSQRMTREVLARFPGMRSRYRRLVEAYLPTRIQPDSMPDDEALQEQAIQQALREPGSVFLWPAARRMHQPVHLWLLPEIPVPVDSVKDDEAQEPDSQPGNSREGDEESRRRQAERVDTPERDRGLLALRFESIFGWSEYVKVDRGTEENDDMEEARREADDMDIMSVARDNQSIAARIRFDLDLPASNCDDLPIGEGTRLPEWDHRKQRLIEDACLATPLIAADSSAIALPSHLRSMARQVRNQFQMLLPARVWLRGQPQGQEIDLDAYLQDMADSRAGVLPGQQNWYRDLLSRERDLACLLLADLSLSTDSWINNHARVIDVIRDSMLLFADALSVTNDRFALWGFSSRKRDNIRMHLLKGFAEKHSQEINGRIAAIKPGFYTRMGAAIRFAARQFEGISASRRVLLILTDGKPNDLDQYEGRYGMEDTRMAIREAKQQGLHPFCVTIDEKARNYLPYLFGSNGYVLIRNPAELPRKLPLLYAQLAE